MRDSLYPFFAATLNKMTKTIAAAKESDVHVVSADVLDSVKTEGIIAQIKSRAISEWGSDVSSFLMVMSWASTFCIRGCTDPQCHTLGTREMCHTCHTVLYSSKGTDCNHWK